MISQLIHHILIASICSTLFASAFILLRNILFKYIGARWNYYLWFIIFIPWFSIWLPLNFLPDMDTSLNFHILTDHLDTHIHQSVKASYSLLNLFFKVWLSGFMIASIYLLIRHFQFIFFLKEHSQPLTVIQKETVKKAIVSKNSISLTRIYISNILSSPMICHIIQSRIYLPENFFSDYTITEQKYILQHECVHYQRCDLIANTVMLVLICINWFNPIIYFSYRYFRSAQELSCDSIISQQFSSSEKKAYGLALLKSAFQPSSQIASMSCWWNSGKQLKERCSMLKYHHAKPIRNLLGLFVLTTAASVAIAAPNLEKRDIAADMKVSNSSKSKLSFSIDNICSEEIGVINSHSVKVVSRKHINNACQANPTRCVTQVYSTDNCSGNSIATLVFDITGWGVMSIMPHTDSYRVGANGFNLFFDGPWTA